jgi:TonB family protein
MRKYFFLRNFFLLFICLFGSNFHFKAESPVISDSIIEQKELEDKDLVYALVDEAPSFPGGLDSMNNFIMRGIKYPIEALKNGMQGVVLVQFVVGEKGEITDIQIIKSVHPSLDEEAILIIKKMPNWIPGVLKGEIVKCKFVLPISFVLK